MKPAIEAAVRKGDDWYKDWLATREFISVDPDARMAFRLRALADSPEALDALLQHADKYQEIRVQRAVLLACADALDGGTDDTG